MSEPEPWRVYLRRDGTTERVVYVQYLGRRLDIDRPNGTIDVYDYTDIMPETRELFADYTSPKGLRA